MSKIRVEELETLDGLNLAKVEDLAKVGDPETGLDRRVIYVDTVADLQALDTSGLVSGQQASVGEAGMFVWSGSEWLPKNSETITVRIPSDYPTLQDFADDYSNTKFANGGKIEVTLESGYKVESQMLLVDCFMGNVSILSEDEFVEVDTPSITKDFGTPGSLTTRPVMGGIRSVMPEVRCLFKFVDFENEEDATGIHIMESSSIFVAEGCGFTDFPRNGLTAFTGSTAVAINSIFTSELNQEARNAGISSWSGSLVDARGADVSYCYYGARAAVGGTLRFIEGKANECRRHGVRANEGGVLLARLVEAKNCSARGINVSRNGRAEVQESVVTGSNVGVACTKGSTCDASGVNADNCDVGFLCVDASFLAADGSSAEGIRSSANSCRVGYEATTSSIIQAGRSSADNCTEYGYFSRQNSSIGAKASSANGCSTGYYASEGSSIVCSISSATNCGERGCYAELSSSIEANDADFSGAGINGARATRGSRINIADAKCRKGETDESSGSSSDIACLLGSTITATNSKGGLNLTENTVTASGIVFA